MDKSDIILEKLDSMDTEIKSIKLTLENEVRTNIMRVAEGHLDLSRNSSKFSYFLMIFCKKSKYAIGETIW